MITKRQYGFTLVELLVVVTVIVVLATITIFAFGSWRQRTAKTEVKSALSAAAAAMKTEKNFGAGYPLALPSSYSPGSGVTVTYKAGGTATSYCLDGVSVAVPSVTMHVTETQQPVDGVCP